MSFEKHIPTKGRSEAPLVSLRTNGKLGFSVPAVRRYIKITRYRFAILYFDKDKRRVGIEFTNDSAKAGVLKICKSKSTQEYYINIQGFCTEFKISLKKTRRYLLRWNKSLTMHVFNLKEKK